MKLLNGELMFLIVGKPFLFVLVVVLTLSELSESSWGVQENVHFVLDS